MAEKRYLKWYNKVGYGSGDIAGNVVYAFLSSFVMIYLTNTVGLNPGIVGTLIAVSKLLDGVTDIFFGSLIDKTHSKMGKARPWMLYGYIGCAITLGAVTALGGGAAGWRTVAIIYAIISLIANTLSVFSVKELPESELVDTSDKKEIEQDEKYNLVQAAKLLAGNKYYMIICGTYILQRIYGAMISMSTTMPPIFLAIRTCLACSLGQLKFL